MSLPKPLHVGEPPRDWLTIVFKLGVPSAIAVYLVWQLASGIPAIARTLDAHVAEYRSGQSATQALLYAICLNTARSDDAKALCEVRR